MLPCPSCSAPRFKFSNADVNILDAIPTNSLSVELGSSVRKATQRIEQLDHTSRSIHDGDLGAIDHAIQELNQNLQLLKALKTQRLAFAANLRSRIPYIHMLPSDILCRVFLFCSYDCPRATLTTTLRIVSVCRRWKGAIEKIPSKWIRLPMVDVMKSSNDSLRLYKIWLRRSQSELLLFHLTFPPIESRPYREPQDVDPGDQVRSSTAVSGGVIALIDQAKPRIGALKLEIAGNGIEELRILGTVGFRELRNLRVCLGLEGQHNPSFPPIFALRNSPKLHDVQINYRSPQQVPPDVPSLARLLPWHQITTLGCQSYLSTNDLVRLLRSAPLLENLIFGIAPLPLHSPTSKSLHELNFYLGTIAHRGITRLELNSVDCEDADYPHNVVRDPIDDFLSRVTLPSLVDLIIWRNVKEDSLSHFDGFVKRSGIGGSLEVLNIDPGLEGRPPVPVEVLESFTTLEHMYLKLPIQQLRFVLQKIAMDDWLPHLRALYLECDDRGADHDFVFLESLFDGLVGPHRQRSGREIELLQVLIPNCERKAIKAIIRNLDHSGRCDIDEYRTRIAESLVKNALESLESAVNKRGEEGVDVNSAMAYYFQLCERFACYDDSDDYQDDTVLPEYRVQQHLHPFILHTKPEILLRLISIEDRLSELRGSPIEWYESLSVHWKAQLESYLHSVGMVYIYDYFEPEEEAESQEADSEGSLSQELAGLGWGPRMGDLVKWPIAILNCDPIHEPKTGWTSVNPLPLDFCVS